MCQPPLELLMWEDRGRKGIHCFDDVKAIILLVYAASVCVCVYIYIYISEKPALWGVFGPALVGCSHKNVCFDGILVDFKKTKVNM